MSMNGLRKLFQRLVRDEEPNLSPFDRLQQQMEDILGNGGILKEVIYPGYGPPVTQSASVLIHYSGFLEYSDLPFETTTHLKHPRLMKLGRDVTLMGMELGLLTMRQGESSRFLLQPRYAYGDMGCPPLIPAAARVLFEVKIHDVLNTGQVDEFVQLTAEEQNECPFSKLIEVVSTLRTLGNRCFKQSRYEKAKEHYKQALELLVNREIPSDAEQAEIQAALLPLYLNLSFVALRLERPRKALKYAKKALEIDCGSTKALYRCAQAYVELRDYENAHGCLVKARDRNPFDSDVTNLLKTVTMCYKDSLDKEKDVYGKMFPGL
ncbi:inactive peptidyl-prolyl cis-trans isomerase FKBP6 isoform X1 [Hippocampus zosterae]|uniref:inactive peptidyl-prolyl cis-trans isomerase FKBP6 isoform X1 n=1 Tax=Hippocampus zosterae TaxID=109293 RepID=UPI00223E3CA4|nr:inactive peptidyl-prolyl cis-trans isomerase FKBP6 isoform X1 [Hippocampus zosterae]